MSQQDRLRSLQVRVSGNDNVAMRFGKVEQRGLQRRELIASRSSIASRIQSRKSVAT